MPGIRFIKLLFITAIAYFSVSCFCRGPELSPELIKDSDAIFEGDIVSADTIANTDGYADELLVTFNVSKLYKGKKQEKIIIKTSNSSCGLFQYDQKDQHIGRHCIIYVMKERKFLEYHVCSNRAVFEQPRKRPADFDFYHTKDSIEYETFFSKERFKLDSLLKLK